MTPARGSRISRRRDRRAGRRRLAIAIAAGLLASGLAACATGDQAADLFAVTRSGSVADAYVTIIPRSDGTVSCDGRRHLMPGLLLIQAEDLQPELEAPAAHAVTLPSGPRPVMTYSVLTPGGHFSYSDDSPHQPAAFKALSYFMTKVARQVCGLPR